MFAQMNCSKSLSDPYYIIVSCSCLLFILIFDKMSIETRMGCKTPARNVLLDCINKFSSKKMCVKSSAHKFYDAYQKVLKKQ